MMSNASIQFIFDEEGHPTGVIVPFDLWQEIASERETAHLLRSEETKKRLLQARGRDVGIPLEVVREKLGV